MLTGGCSLIHGIDHLAEEVLGLPVQPAQPPPLQGITSALANPQLSTAWASSSTRSSRRWSGPSLPLVAIQKPLFGGR